jgi:hypothetical protein
MVDRSRTRRPGHEKRRRSESPPPSSPSASAGRRPSARPAGNQRLQHLLEAGVIRPQLTVNDPDDEYEKEAERVAEAVMRMPEQEPEPMEEPVEDAPADRIQGMCSRCRRRYREGKPLNCEECERELQRKPETDGVPVPEGIKQAAAVVREAGKPLSDRTRSFFEDRMGRDLSDVRVHTGEKADRAARAIDARAFTLGSDVVFRSGEYRPNTRAGKQLLAHELTHVLQQTGKTTSCVPGASDPAAGVGGHGKSIHSQTNVVQQVGHPPALQRWSLKDSHACLREGVTKAKSLLSDRQEQADEAYGQWGCSLDEFLPDGAGPEVEIAYGGTDCAVSWKRVTGDDLISIKEGLVYCCEDCPDSAPVVDVMAHTLIHETAHWCAAKYEKPGYMEHGDAVEQALFGGVTILDDCQAKTVTSYGEKPCFSCPYVVRPGDSLWSIAELRYTHGKQWRRIYEENRETIGDDPNLILPGMRLTIPPPQVVRR